MSTAFSSIYLDTSSLLKLLLPEPESAAVRTAISGFDRAILSPLAELEAEVQIQALRLSGAIRLAQERRLISMLQELRNTEPFRFQPLNTNCFETALQQHRAHREPHCRTVDRLHLSVMADNGVTKIMTHDKQQAIAAKEMGFTVISPA